MLKNTSKDMRMDPLFMRNTYNGHGKWGIPLVRKQELDLEKVSLIACSDTRNHDIESNMNNGVHFFVDDYRFNSIYFRPENSLKKFAQYKFLLTPDYSLYAEMKPWRQMESVAHSRWCGAYWQSKGLIVISTISWSTPSSFEYCFDGVESNAIVAVGMIGCKGNRLAFMRGYNAMLERTNPKAVICFGNPFEEMDGNIIPVDYRSSRKVVR